MQREIDWKDSSLMNAEIRSVERLEGDNAIDACLVVCQRRELEYALSVITFTYLKSLGSQQYAIASQHQKCVRRSTGVGRIEKVCKVNAYLIKCKNCSAIIFLSGSLHRNSVERGCDTLDRACRLCGRKQDLAGRAPEIFPGFDANGFRWPHCATRSNVGYEKYLETIDFKLLLFQAI